MNHEPIDMEMVKNSLVGQSFRNLLKSKNVTKWAVARDCQISYRQLINWQNKSNRPSDESALKVGKYLGLIRPEQHEVETLKRQIQEMSDKINRIGIAQ